MSLHLAFVTVPAPGHTYPGLGLVRELTARGHRVSCVNTLRHADLIATTGARLVPYDSVLPAPDRGDAWPGDPVAQLDLFLDEARGMLPQLHRALSDDRPDLVLYDQAAYAARVLAEQWKIPAVQLSSTFVPWEGYERDGALAPLRDTPHGVAHLRACEKWLTANGIEDADPVAFTTRPERGLVPVPRFLQPRADEVNTDRYTFVGPLTPPVGRAAVPAGPEGDPAHDGWKDRRASATDKLLLVSLGSLFTDRPAVYRSCLDAFGGLPGWHVVMQTGPHVTAADLGPLPANVEVHSWVPQLAVLRRADAFVTHAGMGGTLEGLACAVPMIAVPYAADQFSNARRIAELGAGRRIHPRDLTADALRTALRALDGDPRVRARLGELRETLYEGGGARRAADLIETFAHSRRATQEA
ncbi:macrolide family glycosyltransferase [Streptomyces sp. NPDC021093]|uniref:macrolide family glycosyltransferase n=1 Tax=Streptomyces sp. NPDC021093 TaxID=3365112 RepID=UPI0037B0D2D9